MSPENVPHAEVPGVDTLTPRECEVVASVIEGNSSWVTGKIINCSEETVKKHLQHIYRKLGVENRFSLLALFLRPPESPPSLCPAGSGQKAEAGRV